MYRGMMASLFSPVAIALPLRNLAPLYAFGAAMGIAMVLVSNRIMKETIRQRRPFSYRLEKAIARRHEVLHLT